MGNFLTSPEMYINMKPKDIPKWDSNKFYWEQSKDVIQFFGEELRKFKEGINLNGYYMSGWMYFHLNFFQTAIVDLKSQKRVVGNPPFDDNIYYLFECHKDAHKEGSTLTLWGTRGFAKSTFLGSHEHYSHITNRDGGSSIIVYKDPTDLDSLRTMVTTSTGRIHPAFRLNTLRGKGDWKDGQDVVYGNVLSNNEEIVNSQIRLINADGGAKRASEKGAGLTPIGYKMDEIGKFDPRGIYKSAKPSFKIQGQALFTPILSGTGGNSELSEGAKEMLLNPSDYGLYIMNWEHLNNMVPEEHITWKEDINRQFPVFVPGQMSYRDEVLPKIPYTFGEFTNYKYNHEELNSLVINVTDWEGNKAKFEDIIKNSTLEETRNSQRMYFPMTIDDSFLVNKSSAFNKERIIKKLAEIKKNPKYNLVDIDITNDGKITTTFSDKKLAGREYKGVPVDAPYMIFDGFPTERPGRNLFISASDDYKAEVSTTGSFASMYTLKRRSINEPLERIVACITERPAKHREVYQKWERLLRVTNSKSNIENADLGFVSYLEDVLKQDPFQYLTPHMNPYQELNQKKSKNSGSNQKFGVTPNRFTIPIMIETVIDYTEQEFPVGYDETGVPIMKYGIDLIEDPWLLQEMLDFSEDGNFDRIYTFGWALVYARYLDKHKIQPEDDHVKKFSQDFYGKKRVKSTGGSFHGVSKGLRNF